MYDITLIQKQIEYSLNDLFQLITKKITKPRITDPLSGER